MLFIYINTRNQKKIKKKFKHRCNLIWNLKLKPILMAPSISSSLLISILVLLLGNITASLICAERTIFNMKQEILEQKNHMNFLRRCIYSLDHESRMIASVRRFPPRGPMFDEIDETPIWIWSEELVNNNWLCCLSSIFFLPAWSNHLNHLLTLRWRACWRHCLPHDINSVQQ